MRASVIALVILLFISNNTLSQGKHNSNVDTKNQLNELWELYLGLRTTNEDSAVQILNRIRHIAASNNNLEWQGASYAAVAEIKETQGYLGAAASYYFSAIDIYESFDENSVALADNLNNLSNIFRATGDLYTALRYVDKALFIYQNNVNTEKEQTIAFRNKGIYELELKRYSAGHISVNNGLEIATHKNFEEEKAYLLNLQGTLFYKEGNLKSAKKSYFRGISIASTLESTLPLAYLYHNLGEAQLINEPFLARVNFSKSLELNGVNNSSERISLNSLTLARSTYNLLAKSYLTTNSTDSAILYLEKCIELKTENFVDEEENVFQSLKLLSETLDRSKNINSNEDIRLINNQLIRCNELMLEYMNQLQTLKDKLGLLNKQYVVNFASEKHQLTAQINTAEKKRSQIWQAFWIPVILTIMLAVGMFLLIARLKKVRRYISEISFLMED
jgi:tetratricopeptide (TPR) repeat protein